MSCLEDAQKILVNAELSLRDLIERALSAQHYSDVAVIARIADAIAHLLREDRDALIPLAPVLPANGARQIESSDDAASRASSRPSRGRRTKHGEFPRFERDGDKLVKIGWSKRDERVYEHRAPRETVFLVSTAISTKARPKAVFTMDRILPVSDGSGNEVPSYQAYLALAWLRSIGLVQRRGKEGYALTDGALDALKLQHLWNSIPDRH